MRSFSVFFLLAAFKLAAAAPTPVPFDLGDIFGDLNLNFSGETSEAGLVELSQDDITSKLLRPALFSRAVYCSSPVITALSCGEPCDALGNVQILTAGGDDRLVPNFFVAHDIDTNTIVVAHQGTNSKDPVSVLNDLRTLQVDADPEILPLASGELCVALAGGVHLSNYDHRGCQAARRLLGYPG